MKILKALLRLAASEVLCLFIDITFAASGSTLIRLICLICTVTLMISVLADFSVKEARADMKASRISGEKAKISEIYAAGGAAAVPSLLSWIALCISAKGGGFDYYRWHKLLNAPFLQLYNILSSGVHASVLNGTELAIMAVPIVFPALAVVIPYLAVCRKEAHK
ncbi:hypothetical protein [Ruminococcus flavefaciens]|uniref:hypothetical protein n=1 Tax=Ruminococcus flavefaciens TaxID=1265 RepID=UPI0004900C73|nr:hypothetical protein [Ruminococcus flavefaciens]